MNKSIVITAIVAALVGWVFTYLDARLFDAPKSKFTYVKIMTLCALIAGLVVYFMGGGRPTQYSATYAGPQMGGMMVPQMGGAGGMMALGATGTAVVANMSNERIFTGPPGF